MSNNIYRQAKELLDKNHDYKLSEKERQLINTAIIPLMITKVFPKDITLREGLEELAKLVGEVAAPRGGCWLPGRFHKPVYVGSIPTPATRINSS